MLLTKGGLSERLHDCVTDEAPRDFYYGFLALLQGGVDARMQSTSTPYPGRLGPAYRLVERIWARLTGISRRHHFLDLREVDWRAARIAVSFTDHFSLTLGDNFAGRGKRPYTIGVFHGFSDFKRHLTPFGRRIAECYVRGALDGLDHIAFMCQADRDQAMALYGLSADRTSVFQFGVDTTFWTPDGGGEEPFHAIAVGSDPNRDYATLVGAGIAPPLRAHETTPSFRRDAGLAFLSLYQALAAHGLTIFDCDLESFLPDRFGRPKFFDLQRIVPAGTRKFPYRSFFAHILGPLLLFERRPDLAELLCRPTSRLHPEHYLEITAPRRARFLRRLEFGPAPARAAHRALFADPLAGLLHVGEYGGYLRGLPEEYRWSGRERPAAPRWTAGLVSALRRRLNRMRFGDMVLRKWRRYQSGHDMAALVRAGNDWRRFGETDRRTRTILGELQKLSPTTLTDIGANKGYFSYMAAHLGFDVTALDHGVTMMESIANMLAAADYPLPVRTAAVDLSRIGIDDCWRLRSDVAIALSVTHHLRVATRMPWQRIAAMLSALAERVLLVEFKSSARLAWPAPPSAMLADDYRLENITGPLAKRFPDIRVDDGYAAEANGRTLIICRR